MNIFVETSYFDFDAIGNPVKSYLTTKLSSRLFSNMQTVKDVYIRENEYTLNDNIFGFRSSKGKFYSIGEVVNTFEPIIHGWACRVGFWVDSQKEQSRLGFF